MCGHCGTMNTVTTSKQHKSGKQGPVAYDVNTRLVLGLLNAGIDQMHVNALLSCLNIPSVNQKPVETVARASCMESCNEERASAVAAGAKCDNNNLVGVACSSDMAWWKRGKAHNSSTGHGAVLQVTTEKVLDYSTRNEMCRTCSVAKKKLEKPVPRLSNKSHWTIKNNGVKFCLWTFLPCSGKGNQIWQVLWWRVSTTFAYLKTNVPYGLEKHSNFIHTKCSLNTRLYNLSQRQNFPDSSVMSQKVILYLVKCFSYCVHQHKNQPNELSKAIEGIVPHAFGNREDCSPSRCRYKQNPAAYVHNELPYGKE